MEFSHKFYNTTALAWEGMRQAILDAKSSVYWEIFALVDDLAGKPFIDLLCAKAQAGLDVKLITDAIGSFYLSKDAINRLKKSGVKFFMFNNLRPELALQNWLRRVWHRTHRKVLIIDREVVFIGGVNVAQYAALWHDLHLRLTGKIVIPILFSFAKSYIKAGGDKKDVADLLRPKIFPNLEEIKEKINFIFHSPWRDTVRSPFKNFYKQALGTAKEKFNLLTPYYVPDRHFLELVSQAKKRGVNVNIMIPWRTDERVMRYFASMLYGVSSKAGAVFYFLKNMNHGKAVSVDNKLGMVGSANLTPRSFYINHEAGVTFSDEHMVEELNNILDDWKKEAMPLSEINIGKKVGWTKRFKDWWMNKIRDYV
ncbi:MAG: phosphatidylserine/phosphatidylglycerophosphate/cardiolipin synthase family protein [Candidatus Magasanikbacteria bacterium]|nr:phosphatidylserine/phosphatidylglycerophosphate/cardiolipin synthase family protein [Candidatus Magasanikbacteria bacterium]